jgi:hypothetical protein
MCPRGDLNSETSAISPDPGLNAGAGEESPVWGIHANILTGGPRVVSNWLARSGARAAGTGATAAAWTPAARTGGRTLPGGRQPKSRQAR